MSTAALKIVQNVSPVRGAAPELLTEGDVNLSEARKQWSEGHATGETRKWLEADARHFLHQSLSTPCLDVLESCEGSTLVDIEGRRFLDFHGNSVHQVGYGNPRVIQAIKDQLDRLPFCPRRFTNRPAVELAAKLAECTPGDLSRVLFAPGGTTAVGMALKLARVATGRFKTVSMWDSFHGASLDAISVGGETLFRSGIGPLLPGTEHVPPADPRHCLFDRTGDCLRCGLKCAEYVDYVLEKEGDVAAVIAEPMRCTTATVPPQGYWEAVRDSCTRRGVLLIFDETAVCLGRTGKLFACENFSGVVPDILILGKGLGGGVLPLAAIVAREGLNVASDRSLGHYTHEKNPVACAAGLATLEDMERRHLPARSACLGKAAVERLRDFQERMPLVGDVRGLGLLLAVELNRDRDPGEPARREAEKVLYRCLSLGLSFKVSAGNCLTLTPPLTIAQDEMDRALDILEQAIEEAANERAIHSV